MTRLYTLIKSDRRRNDIGLAANEKIEILVYYGSAKNSTLCSRVRIMWGRDDEKPIVEVHQLEGDVWKT